MYRLSYKYRLGNLQVSVKKWKYNLHSQSSSIAYILLPAVPSSTIVQCDLPLLLTTLGSYNRGRR